MMKNGGTTMMSIRIKKNNQSNRKNCSRINKNKSSKRRINSIVRVPRKLKKHFSASLITTISRRMRIKHVKARRKS